MSAIRYRSEVDGLRAVAVIPVVLFHLGASWIPGGFVGVDVFFVISGYLITSIILKEQAAGTFTFKGFWVRRVRRIMPAMLTMLIATSIAGYFIMFGPSWKGLGEHVISAIGIYANFEMWQLSGNYWGPAAENAPLLHMWSLSVEEQFYLFYPLILLALLKFLPRRVFAVVLVGTFLSFALGVYATKHSPNAAFYFLPTRAWELAAGCLLAIFERERGPAPSGNISRSLAFAGLGLIAAAYYLTQGADGFPGFWALLPVVGAVLIIRFASTEGCFVGRLLGFRLIVYIGKCSYSLYLWHWPVIVLAAAFKLRYPNLVSIWSVLAVVIVFTLVSYHFIECPTRKMKHVITPVLIGLLVSCASAFYLRSADYEYDLSALEPTESYTALYDVAPVPPEANEGIEGVTVQRREASQYTAYSGSGIMRQFGGEVPSVVVLGSSHALMWGRTIELICEELELTVVYYSARATPPWISLPVVPKPARFFTAEQKAVFDATRLESIQEWSPEIIIIIDRWSSRGDPFEYTELMRYFESCGSKVIFVGQPPELSTGNTSIPLLIAYQYAASNNPPEYGLLEAHNKDKVNQANDRLRLFAESLDFCFFVGVQDLFETEDAHVIVRGGREVFYIDEDHLSQAGVLRAKGRLKQAVGEILKHK